MKSRFGLFASHRKKDKIIEKLNEENNLLRLQINELRDAISPLTGIGIRTEDAKNILQPYAAYLLEEIKKVKKTMPDTSYRSTGKSASSPIKSR